MKEILEYTGSIHQPRCWSQELFDYEFAIIHRAASIIKDVDGLSSHIDILIHGYLTQASRMRLTDIVLRSFAYSLVRLTLVLIHVVSLLLTLLYPLKYLQPFPYTFEYSSFSNSLYFKIYSSIIFRSKTYFTYLSSYCPP